MTTIKPSGEPAVETDVIKAVEAPPITPSSEILPERHRHTALKSSDLTSDQMGTAKQAEGAVAGKKPAIDARRLMVHQFGGAEVLAGEHLKRRR